MSLRARLDAELVRRDLASSRQEAQELIGVGRVLVNGAIASKPSHLVARGDSVHVSGPPRRFVSRGGEKLQAAIDFFQPSVRGCRALDAGASTGGFTDCLLQSGAREVVAVDVGHGQMHPKIRNDERVAVIERFNVREMTIAEIGGSVDLVVADLSFISLTVVVDALASVLTSRGGMILLVKPQFEVGRADASRTKGIISDPSLHSQACEKVERACVNSGVEVIGIIPSPLLGQGGNQEFLLYGHLRGEGSSTSVPSGGITRERLSG